MFIYAFIRKQTESETTIKRYYDITINTFHNDYNEPETQRLHQLIIHNYYFEDVLNSLSRRIEYFTSNNQFISEDRYMKKQRNLKRKRTSNGKVLSYKNIFINNCYRYYH